MLKRFGTWMYRYRRGFALVILVAGVLALLLMTHGSFRGVEMAFWQSRAQACGTLYVVDGRVSSGDPQAATTCFMQAYTHCRAATLVESFNVENTDRNTLVIEPVLLVGGAHPCSIQVNLTPVGISANRPDPYDWTECAGVDQRSDGLHIFGCGQGSDFVVPST
jgi:hypothetical protein